jgi:hypothetical protein
MNEKKVREAIEALKIINLKRVHPFYDWEEMREIRDIAIEALEKQLPKKPDIMDYILGDINFKCPTCKSEYICEKGYEHFYCPNCGQKIKWSE